MTKDMWAQSLTYGSGSTRPTLQHPTADFDPTISLTFALNKQKFVEQSG